MSARSNERERIAVRDKTCPDCRAEPGDRCWSKRRAVWRGEPAFHTDHPHRERIALVRADELDQGRPGWPR